MKSHRFSIVPIGFASLCSLSLLSLSHASNPADPELEAALAASRAAAEEHDAALIATALSASQNPWRNFTSHEADADLDRAIAASNAEISLNGPVDDDLALALATSASEAQATVTPAVQPVQESDLDTAMRESEEAERRRQQALAEEEEAQLAAILEATAAEAGVRVDLGGPSSDPLGIGAAPVRPTAPVEDARSIRRTQDREFAESALVDLAREEGQIMAHLQQERAQIQPAREAFEQAQRDLANDEARLQTAAGNPRLTAAVAASRRQVADRQKELETLEGRIEGSTTVRHMLTRLDEIAALRVQHQQMLEQ